MVGELKRHLRDTSWRLHVARPLEEQALRLCRAADELHQRLGRSPSTSELAEHLGPGEEVVLEGLAAAGSRLEVSLDQPVGEDGEASLGDLMAAAGAREEPEDLLVLPGLVAALPVLEGDGGCSGQLTLADGIWVRPLRQPGTRPIQRGERPEQPPPR